MIFETCVPDEPLYSSIENIIYYKDLSFDHEKERVIPTGHAYLLMAFDGYEREIYDDQLKTQTSLSKAWFSGPHQKTLNISAHPKSEMMAIQFNLTGALPIIHSSLSQFAGKVLQAELVFGESIFEIYKEVQSVEGPADKVNRMVRWLSQRCQKDLDAPVWLDDAVEEMRNNPYSKHNEIVEGIPYSHKHFIQYAKKHIGLTPKTLHRLFRFSSLLKRVQNEEQLRWAEVSYDTGYSDQAHFAKDFLRFSGFQPSFFKKVFKDYPGENFFPLDSKPPKDR